MTPSAPPPGAGLLVRRLSHLDGPEILPSLSPPGAEAPWAALRAPVSPAPAAPPSASPGRRDRRFDRLAAALHRPLNLVFMVVLIAVATAWWVEFRPSFILGGPASFVVVHGDSMNPTLHTGDFVFATAQPAYKAGDIVIYSVPAAAKVGVGDEIIHRIVGGSAAQGYTLKGDNNPAPDPWTVPAKDILGESTLVVPNAGQWLLLTHSPIFAAILGALVAMYLVLRPPDWLRRLIRSAA